MATVPVRVPKIKTSETASMVRVWMNRNPHAAAGSICYDLLWRAVRHPLINLAIHATYVQQFLCAL